jgi:hypothetical protein
MKANPYRRHSVAAAVAAAFVTIALMGALSESLNPSRLFQSARRAADNPVVALDRRAEPAGSELA